MSDDAIEPSRRFDALAMVADEFQLRNLRPDLSAVQRRELYMAAVHRLQDGFMRIPPTGDIFAWIDLVIPRGVELAVQQKTPPSGVISSILSIDAERLRLGPKPAVTAAPLAALAQRRPDLSDIQRHELLVGARGRLVRYERARKIEATRGAIFAWIDVVVPDRRRVTDGRTKEDVKRPTPSLDDLEDRAHAFRQRLRVRDEMESLEADQALDRLVPAHPETDRRASPEEPPSHVFRTGKPGPSPMLTREEVERTGQDLASRGLPAGERSIARELGASRDAVRYALGKEQGRRSRS